MSPKSNDKTKAPVAPKQATIKSFFRLPQNVKPAKLEQTTLTRGKPQSVELERDEVGDVIMVDKFEGTKKPDAQKEATDELEKSKIGDSKKRGINKRKRASSQESGKESSDMEVDTHKGAPAAKKRELSKRKDSVKETKKKVDREADVDPARKVAAVEKKMKKVTIKKEESAEEISEEEVKSIGAGRRSRKVKKVVEEEEEEEEKDEVPIKKRARPPKERQVIKQEKEAMPLRKRGQPGKAKEDDEEDSTEDRQEAPKTKKEATQKKMKGKVVTSSTKPSKSARVAEKGVKEEIEEHETTPKSDSEVEASASETEKPSLSISAVKQLQKELLTDEHPYPDWKPGTPTPYAAVCTSFSLIEGTTKRLEKIKHLSLLLRQVLRLNSSELLLVVHILTNKLAADFEGIELGMGESTLIKAIAESCGRSIDKIRADQRKIGDLGAVAAASRQNQSTLRFGKKTPLTVANVHEQLLQIATSKGEGTLLRKIDIIKKMLANAGMKGDEAKYIVRALEGKMRLGTADVTVLAGLSQAFVFWEKEKEKRKPTLQELQDGEQILKAVFSQCPSFEVIIPATIQHGISKLKEIVKLQPGIPLKPMLAKPSKSIAEAVDNFGKSPFTLEYKYDGERTQIHYVSPNSNVEYAATKIAVKKKEEQGMSRIFSRNSEDLSVKYPDVLSAMETWIKPGVDSFVLDCESVAWDETEKKLLPFQTLMTRKRKDVAIEDIKIKVQIFAFDLLFLNGKSLVKEPLSERRRLMYESFTPIDEKFNFVSYKDSSSADDVEAIQSFLEESIKASCEGLMAKALIGAESYYEPSMRSQHWIKIKKDYLAGLGDSLDLVVLGAYHGKGKRTSVYGAFLLGCYNPSKEIYETICNIGTGFSDQMLEELHGKLVEHGIDRPKPYYSFTKTSEINSPDVWFEPAMVWEVKTADLTISPVYKAAAGLADHGATDKGISLRFPRFLRIREDKKPEEATTSRQVLDMYKRQEIISNGNAGKKSVDDDFEY